MRSVLIQAVLAGGLLFTLSGLVAAQTGIDPSMRTAAPYPHIISPEPSSPTSKPPSHPKPHPPVSQADPSEPFLKFEKHTPLRPDTMNMFGYEFDKSRMSIPVLSPDKQRMAFTEAHFMPQNSQTYTRAVWVPIDPPQDVKDAQTAQVQAQTDPYTKPQKTSSKIPTVKPDPYWQTYQPEKKPAQRHIMFEAGFSTYDAYRFDSLRIIDWSPWGDHVLFVYRRGGHHMGVYRTIPMVYDVRVDELTRLDTIPFRVWTDFQSQYPEMAQKAPEAWDVQTLGWAAGRDSEILLKLNLFTPAEQPAGFWSYDIETGVLQYLGDYLTKDKIGTNGWLASFVDPNAQGGPKTYAPGETIPPPEERPRKEEPKRFGWLRFWEK